MIIEIRIDTDGSRPMTDAERELAEGVLQIPRKLTLEAEGTIMEREPEL